MFCSKWWSARERRLKSTALEEVAIYSFGLKYWHLSGGLACAGTQHHFRVVYKRVNVHSCENVFNVHS